MSSQSKRRASNKFTVGAYFLGSRRDALEALDNDTFQSLIRESPYILAENLAYFVEERTLCLDRALGRKSNPTRHGVAACDPRQAALTDTYPFFAGLIHEVGMASPDLVVVYMHMQRYHHAAMEAAREGRGTGLVLTSRMQMLCAAFTAISVIYDETLCRSVWETYSGKSWNTFVGTAVEYAAVYGYKSWYDMEDLLFEYGRLRTVISRANSARAAARAAARTPAPTQNPSSAQAVLPRSNSVTSMTSGHSRSSVSSGGSRVGDMMDVEDYSSSSSSSGREFVRPISRRPSRPTFVRRSSIGSATSSMSTDTRYSSSPDVASPMADSSSSSPELAYVEGTRSTRRARSGQSATPPMHATTRRRPSPASSFAAMRIADDPISGAGEHRRKRSI